MKYYDILDIAAKDVNMQFDEEKYNKFIKYMDMIVQWNKVMNLTAITEKEEIIKKHFIDSIKIFTFTNLNNLKKIADIGTGAGFPGIPISIMNPDINILLVDSLNKRINFLNEVIKELGLTNIVAIHGRAEELGKNKKYRQQFDGIVSRAVANMTTLSELCLPLVRVGGYFVAMKGPSVTEEIDNANGAISKLGARVEEVKALNIEDTDLQHNIVILKKQKETPSKYPRKFADIKKKPII